jgi:D-alanine-D-alanine ligase
MPGGFFQRREMAEKSNIAVLFGGRSGEHEVSLMSARSVISVLDPQKYHVIQVGITHDGRWLSGPNALEALTGKDLTGLFPVAMLPEPGHNQLYRLDHSKFQPYENVDVYFPVLHGSFGEDGTLQGLFEMADVTYVGAGVLGSAVGMDKALFKDVMRANQIPVVESLTFLRNEIEADVQAVLADVESVLKYPVFVKPVNLGSSVGVSKCKNRSDLLEGVLDAARYDRRVLIERGVNGREIEVSVLGNRDPKASIPGEIVPSDEFYSYKAKYIDDHSQLIIPARIDAATSEQAMSLAVQAFTASDCAGMARVDFLLERESNELFLNELNTIPGFTKISMYPKLWEATGISYPDLVNHLIRLAFERKEERDRIERVYKA